MFILLCLFEEPTIKCAKLKMLCYFKTFHGRVYGSFKTLGPGYEGIYKLIYKVFDEINLP